MKTMSISVATNCFPSVCVVSLLQSSDKTAVFDFGECSCWTTEFRWLQFVYRKKQQSFKRESVLSLVKTCKSVADS